MPKMEVRNLTTTSRFYGFVVLPSSATGTPGPAVHPTSEQIRAMGEFAHDFAKDIVSKAIVVSTVA